jgi:hypothetical protein
MAHFGFLMVSVGLLIDAFFVALEALSLRRNSSGVTLITRFIKSSNRFCSPLMAA